MTDLRVCRAGLHGGVVRRAAFVVPLILVALLLQVGCGAGDGSPRKAPGHIELPVVGTLGRAPAGPGTIVVDVDGDGRISVDGEGPLSLIGLRDELQRRTANPRWREPDRSSLKILLVNADASLPWPVAVWVMQVAAGPTIGLYRVFFGARARASGEVGALGWALPKDMSCGSMTPSPEHVGLSVRLSTHDGPASEPEDLLAPLRKAAGEHPVRNVKLDLVVLRGKSGPVSTGFVVRVAAVALAAGVRWLFMEGAPPPFPVADADDVDALLRRVAELKAKTGYPTLRVGKETLGALPSYEPVPVARGRLDHLYGSRVEKTEPKPPSDEEPTIRDPGGTEDPDEVEFAGYPHFSFLADLQARVGAFPARERSESKRRTGLVEVGLSWLAAHQSPNGGWEAAGFGRWCAGKETVEGDWPGGRGRAHHDAGVTGLAVSAFLGAGYTNRGRHPYAKTVSKGLRYLKNVQDAEGCFGPRTHPRFVYDHAAAALAMIEAYGMTGSPIFKGSAQKALDFVLLCKNPGSVWRYGVKPGDDDTSVTAWMAMPLIAARWINQDAEAHGRPAPLRFETDAFAAVLTWLDRMTDPETGRTGYQTRGSGPDRPADLLGVFPRESSESTTAAGVLLRVLLSGVSDPGDADQAGVARLEASPPRWDPDAGTIDHVYWYFGALAAHQAGGDLWNVWNASLGEVVRGSQRLDTDPCRYMGSWDPIGPWGREGGRVASTALMTMTLEVTYRYPRTFGLR